MRVRVNLRATKTAMGGRHDCHLMKTNENPFAFARPAGAYSIHRRGCKPTQNSPPLWRPGSRCLQHSASTQHSSAFTQHSSPPPLVFPIPHRHQVCHRPIAHLRTKPHCQSRLPAHRPALGAREHRERSHTRGLPHMGAAAHGRREPGEADLVRPFAQTVGATSLAPASLGLGQEGASGTAPHSLRALARA